MASKESSNRSVAFARIPSLLTFLKGIGKTPKNNKFEVRHYALWFNAYANQVERYHSLSTSNKFTSNSMDDIKSTYERIFKKIKTEAQQNIAVQQPKKKLTKKRKSSRHSYKDVKEKCKVSHHNKKNKKDDQDNSKVSHHNKKNNALRKL